MRDTLAGKTVGEYRILAPLGEGGMGVVYAAVNTRIDKRVAIKVLKGKGAEQDRLIAEAVAVNQVGHRNVVTIFGTGVLPDGRRYIVMEYLDGEPLDAYLKRSGRLPALEVCELLQDVCSPLHAAHQRGIVHRDLKPANVYLVNQGDGSRFVKVLDFGLARLRVATTSYDNAQTRDLILEGTPEYMSPEQCTAQPIGAWTDLYALGSIAFEMLSGEPPFHRAGAAPIEIMTAKVRTPAPQLQPPVPEPLITLVAQLLATRPLERPTSAEAVRNQLRRIARMIREGANDVRFTARQSQPVEQTLATPTGMRPMPKRRALVPAIGGAAAAVVLLGGAATLWMKLKPAKPPPPKVVMTPAGVEAPHPPREPERGSEPPAPAARAEHAGEAVASAPPPGETPRPRRASAPSLEELQRRLAALEARHQRLKEPDPEAKVALSSFRVRITVVSSPADRTELMRDFQAWEKRFGR